MLAIEYGHRAEQRAPSYQAASQWSYQGLGITNPNSTCRSDASRLNCADTGLSDSREVRGCDLD